MNEQQVGKLAYKKILALSAQTSRAKALRAQLRGVGFGDPVDAPGIWGLLYSDMDDLGAHASEQGDRALLHTLVLYANHERNARLRHDQAAPKLGQVLFTIRQSADNVESFDAKVTRLMAAEDESTLARRLNALLGLSKKPLVLNFATLAQDLHRIQFASRARVLRSWSESYYSRLDSSSTSKESERNVS